MDKSMQKKEFLWTVQQKKRLPVFFGQSIVEEY